jgi:hypothetical protein
VRSRVLGAAGRVAVGAARSVGVLTRPQCDVTGVAEVY